MLSFRCNFKKLGPIGWGTWTLPDPQPKPLICAEDVARRGGGVSMVGAQELRQARASKRQIMRAELISSGGIRGPEPVVS